MATTRTTHSRSNMSISTEFYKRIGKDFPDTPLKAKAAILALSKNPLPKKAVDAASEEDKEWLAGVMRDLYELKMRG